MALLNKINNNAFIIVLIFISINALITTCSSSSSLSLIPQSLNPPAGNSLSMKVRTENGVQVYRCEEAAASGGKWVPDAAFASLVDTVTGAVVGNFSQILSRVKKTANDAGRWTLLNDDGDHAESGSAYSAVTGRKIARVKPTSKLDLSDFLAVASSHTNEGSMSMVSYVSRVGTKGGRLGPQPRYSCSTKNNVSSSSQRVLTIRMPFEAQFYFWKQDLLPPMESIPNSLKLDKQRPIQAFYAYGSIVYVNNGTQWLQKQMLATMFDVPGGTQVGSFFTKPLPNKEDDALCWHIDNPNGFEVTGKLACKPEIVSSSCLPWSLNLVTTTSGNLSLFGPYTYIQMVSTMGGLPPTKSSKPRMKEQIWKAKFSTIFWFYSKV